MVNVVSINTYDTTLYTISGGAAQAAYELEQIMGDPDLSDEARQAAIDDTFARFHLLAEALPEKLENCAKYVKSLEREQEIIKAEEKALSERRKSLERREASFKGYMLLCLQGLQERKIKTPLVTLWIGKSRLVEITDEQVLPSPKRRPDLWTIPEPEYSKTAIKKALEAGEQIEGARIVTKEHVVIK